MDAKSFSPPPTYVSEFHNLESVQKTLYRRLGNTDLHVSKLSLGAAAFGGVYYGIHPPVSEILEEALRNGINYIDTAYWYGQGKSEQRLGEAFKTLPRSAYYIATKVGRYEQGWENMFDFRGQTVLQSLDNSLARLGLPYVDVLMLHDFEYAFFPSPDIIHTETLPAMDTLRRSGKARYIGITGYPVENLPEILDKSPVKVDLIYSYSRSNLHDQSLSQYIPYFEQKKLGVIHAAPTSLGLLTPREEPEWHPAGLQLKSAARTAREYCSKRKIDIAKLATHFALNFPGVQSTLSSAHSIEILRSNLETSWLQSLSMPESQCLGHLKTNIFGNLGSARNWVGIEPQIYRKFMNDLAEEKK